MTDQPRPGLLRRLYDWVLGWADTPYGLPALACIAFIESSVFPIPPDVLLIALVLGARRQWARFALAASLASVAGGCFGYFLGAVLWTSVSTFFFGHVPGFTPESFQHVTALYEQFDFWIVFTAGFSPLPYKVITISSGVFGIYFPVFFLASALSRSARFFLLAWLLRCYGQPIRAFIDRYFNLLAIAFVVLLFGGFLVFGTI